MILYMEGHDFRYAVEQCQLVFFPGERPVFVKTAPSPQTDSAISRLSFGDRWATAVTIIRHKGTVSRGMARAPASGYPDEQARRRGLSYAVKFAFYRAACLATGYRPPWGALTGIRPAGMLRSLAGTGLSLPQAERALGKQFDVAPRKSALCLSAARTTQAVESSLQKNDISLYVGIPFCPTRCTYCSFVSHSVDKAGHLLPEFLTALSREIRAVGLLISELHLRPVTLYIGGGTPTTLSDTQLDTLLGELDSSINLSSLREFTVEAGRPDTVTREKMTVLKRRGVTRVSVNPQSMSNRILDTIGRRHTAADTLNAYNLARAAGFQINTDLIAGLPGDTACGFADSLSQVLALAPDNVTLHTLARKKGSALTNQPSSAADPEQIEAMLNRAYGTLSEADYHCYYLYRQKYMAGPFENTGWARPGQENLYNVCMMEELHTVLSLGGGGVSKLVDSACGRVDRIFNPKYPYEYLSRIDDVLQSKDTIRVFFQEIRKN